MAEADNATTPAKSGFNPFSADYGRFSESDNIDHSICSGLNSCLQKLQGIEAISQLLLASLLEADIDSGTPFNGRTQAGLICAITELSKDGYSETEKIGVRLSRSRKGGAA